jgi:hypothetical protein
MPERVPVKQVSRNSVSANCIVKTIDAGEKRLILSVLKSEIGTLGLEGNYVRRLKRFEHKLISFENIELSEKEKSFLVSLMEAFCVLEGQKWSADRIYDLNRVYRNLGGQRWLPDDWLFWKTINRKRSRIARVCPYCGREIVQLCLAKVIE